jgi:trk system potassium uptake protein TrkA
MKYIIVGCGRVGSQLAKLLSSESHEVVVIDENPAAFKRLGSRFSGRVEVGTGIDYDVLKRAGLGDADGFIAVTDGDNRNVMAALIAQRLFGIKKIVARIYDPPRGQLYRELGIETVCPTTIGAKIIRDKILHMPFESSPSFDYGNVSSLSVIVPKRLAGKTAADFERPGLVKIVALRRRNDVIVPKADAKFEAGDELNAVVAPEALQAFLADFKSDDSVPVELTA